MKDKVEELINEAQEHTLDKNIYLHQKLREHYTKSTPELQGWIAECEDYILKNYGKDSAPWRIFERLDVRKFDGNYPEDFDKQKKKIISALTSCLRIKSTKNTVNHIPTPELDLSKVFIVHGHDELLKNEVARFIEKLKLEAIILHEKASSGKTIIEKIEEYSNVGFGIVLYTGCDIGAKNEENPTLQNRARQNVVFEHGFLISKIGRRNVCALVKGDIEKPNDISGVVYVSTQEEWRLSISKELKNSGYNIDMNLVI
ncbi:TIR domain-containing protein [Polaribacter atrinae]|uniref:Nucleotide-binding protein n=1 Tax=Polaribacter atrinae TaxID=1333662 RepID=A0A176TEP1_9FLAO|nr:nucleotide-binding protein [Polaribacter atrinae]OAD46342.1 nucleotide-binding protein [Polaribacter atrinae]